MRDPVLKGKIDAAGTVAFDVFDTLLVRPFFEPDHVFDYIERVKGASGFAAARVSAEGRARHVYQEEVTLGEIYSLLAGEYASLMDFEIECEVSLCKADPLAKEVWDYCISAGKNVVVISDMYLSSEVIGRMLSKCGFEGYSELLVSCEHRVNKCSGELYSKVDGTGCLMIGDNPNSDVRKPREKGWDSYRWIPAKERYALAHKHEVLFAKKGFGQSLIAGTDMFQWLDGAEDPCYWHSVGRRFGGPLTAMYALFVMENTRDSDCLFFLSRDGYMMMKAYGLLGGVLPCRYVYSSRFLKSVYGGEPSDDIKEVFARECSALGTGPEERLVSGKEDYIRYLEDCAFGFSRITVVDSTTLNFSSQEHLRLLLGERIVSGCYYSVIKGSRGNACYSDRSHELVSWNNVNLSEFLHSSSEPPIWDVDGEGRPRYLGTNSEHEVYRGSVMEEIHDGETAFLEYFRELYSAGLPLVCSKTLDGWLKVLLKSEKKGNPGTVREMKWPVDPTNSEYVDLIWRPRDLGYALRILGGSLLRRLHLKK